MALVIWMLLGWGRMSEFFSTDFFTHHMWIELKLVFVICESFISSHKSVQRRDLKRYIYIYICVCKAYGISIVTLPDVSFATNYRLHHFPISSGSCCCWCDCAAQSPWPILLKSTALRNQNRWRRWKKKLQQQCASQWIHIHTWVGVYYIHTIIFSFFSVDE